MAAASQPARISTFLEQLEDVLLRTRANIQLSRELIRASRNHCETSHCLTHENGELRDFLRENVLNTRVRREHRLGRQRELELSTEASH